MNESYQAEDFAHLNIEVSRTWNIIDSSKASTYATCPRKYFYSYILGWRPDSVNHDLVFGEAWHRAKEHMMLTGNKDVDGAMGEFLIYYRQYFQESTDLDYHPKSPGNAYTALKEYQKQYGTDEFEVVLLDGVPMTEIYGTVPIDEHRMAHFRIDCIVNTDKGKEFMDSKTSKMLSKWWSDQFSLSLQMGLYIHVMNCVFPNDNNGGRIDGSIFRKGGNDHIRVPVRRTLPMMQDWLWTFTEFYNDIERDMVRLSKCQEGHEVMMAFPKNPEGCFKYNRTCSFHDFCTSWNNPLKRADKSPMGLVVEWWDPADRKDHKAKHVINIKDPISDI